MAGIKDTKIIKGQPHLLTYITPNEVEKLKALGGQETMTPEGIPAYPEFDNYGFSSQADFDSGDVSKSNDPNVRGTAPGQNRVTASQLAAINAKEKQDAIKKDIAKRELEKLNYAPKSVFERIGIYNDKYKQKMMQKAIQRTKYANLKELDALKQQSRFGVIGTVMDAFNVDPETDMFDTESPREIAAQLSKAKTGITASQSKAIGDLQQDIAMENTKNISQNDFNEYMNRNKTVTNDDGRGGGQPYIPINYNTGAAEVVEPYTNDFTYDKNAFGPGGDSADVTRASYIFNKGGRAGKSEGGIMGTRARRAMGGIMNRVDQRQGYFLGKIVKGVKGVVGGVVDATKKVLKSDLGKAALIYGGGAMLGSYGAGKGFFSPGMFNPANMGRGLLGTKGVGMAGGTSGLFGKIGLTEGFGALMPTLKGAGVLGLGALGLFGNKAAPNETSFSDRGGRLKNSQGQEGNQAIRDEIYEAYESGDQDRIMQLQKFYGYKLPSLDAVQDMSLPSSLPYPNYAEGGRIGKAEGGLMDLGGMEKDYRAEGGFVPIGEYEKKDDVPARLSVNEFVFTADAVRGAGQGDIDKGAEIMENMMENLENGGTISEESQGKNGAQQMFETSQRLGEVV